MASKARQAMIGSRRDGTVTVIGATGQQGGAVIDALLGSGFAFARSLETRTATRVVRSLSAG